MCQLGWGGGGAEPNPTTEKDWVIETQGRAGIVVYSTALSTGLTHIIGGFLPHLAIPRFLTPPLVDLLTTYYGDYYE